MSQISFTVLCKPEPQGSKKGFVVNGRCVIVDDNKVTLRAYRSAVTQHAIFTLRKKNLPRPMVDTHLPVEVVLEFMFRRPKSGQRRVWPTVKPDIDKLERATLDALTGVLFADDAQVVSVVKTKVYGEQEHVYISVRLMTEGMLF